MESLRQGKSEYSEIGTECSVYERASLLVSFYEQRNQETRQYESENYSDYTENYQLRIKSLRGIRTVNVHKKTAWKSGAENELFRLSIKSIGQKFNFLKYYTDEHQQEQWRYGVE